MSARERYEFAELIGEGGFGRTHAATRRETGEPVVIKELLLRELSDWKPVEHFEREAKVLGALAHPGIPRFIEAFEDQGEDDSPCFYIVSERIFGETLGARIEAGQRWTGEQAVALARALLEILHYLHELLPPVIHRDIKPDNIVLRESGAPVLVDFGAVRDLALPGVTGGATVLGTPGYMAPEQSLGRADARSDLYSLGATLAQVFTHRHPQQLLDASMQIDASALALLPSTVRELLIALTRVDPTARPESAASALALLDGRITGSAAAKREPATSAALATLGAGERGLAPLGGRELTPAIARELAARPMRPEQLAKTVLPLTAATVAVAVAIPLIGIGGLAMLMPLVLMCGALPVVAVVRARRRARELYARGVELAGRVSSANSTQVGAFIEYEYEVEGTTHSGYAHTRDTLALAGLERGSPIRVFHDPQDPSVSVGLLDVGERT